MEQNCNRISQPSKEKVLCCEVFVSVVYECLCVWGGCVGVCTGVGVYVYVLL